MSSVACEPAGEDTEVASAALAESLSTVGYAMFAWLQQGPLEQIKPMPVVVDQMLSVMAAEEAQRAVERRQQDQAQSLGSQVAEVITMVEGQGALGRPVAPSPSVAAPPVAPPPAASSRTAQAPDGSPVDPAVPAEPDVPAGPAPEPGYTGDATLAMLAEISFLDE